MNSLAGTIDFAILLFVLFVCTLNVAMILSVYRKIEVVEQHLEVQSIMLMQPTIPPDTMSTGG